MGLLVENPDVERLIAEVTLLTGETESEAVRKSLEERRERLVSASHPAPGFEAAIRWLREEVWPSIPPEIRGRGIRQEEQDEILGYGPGGV